MRLPAAVFAGLFALYLYSANPSLAPYRDSGEMASSAWTLGVSHPTSYPAYVALGHLAQSVPLGNPAYRLTVLSAAAAAAAAAAVFAVAAAEWGPAAGAAGALLLGLNPTFWSIAIVQEMYGLWILAAALLAGLALRLRREYSERRWLGFAFCAGLALGNRLDLLLWAPGLVWLALSERETGSSPAWAGLALLAFPAAIVIFDTNAPIALLIVLTALWRAPGGRARWALFSGLAALAGLSVYLYLPIRSAGGPWLDWNHPAAIPNFVDSILRTRYGGTLDLLSKSYAKGELFGANMRLYGSHLWSAFGPLGLAAAAFGLLLALRREPRRFLGQLACWWWSGPVFLLIANMPPNPHAAVIVEPHYLLSDTMLVLFAAEGAAAVLVGTRAWAPALALVLFGAVPFARGVWTKAQRRESFLTEDFARAAFAAARPGGVLVAKKDVPLYTLWYYQLCDGLRPDVRVVAQGLAGSPWYQADWRRRDSSLYLTSLRDARGWTALSAGNGDVAATADAEPPGELMSSAKARGLLTAWSDSPEDAALWALSRRRGDYRYEEQPDFFGSDAVDEFAQAALRSRRLTLAWSMHWLFPEPAALLAYEAFTRGDFAAARRYYEWAAELSDRLIGLGDEYHALQPVKDGLRRGAAEQRAQLAVALEKLGSAAEAEKAYRAALERYPLSRAHYGLAVLAWKTDPERAERELETALALDPSNQDASKYLALIRQRRAIRK